MFRNPSLALQGRLAHGCCVWVQVPVGRMDSRNPGENPDALALRGRPPRARAHTPAARLVVPLLSWWWLSAPYMARSWPPHACVSPKSSQFAGYEPAHQLDCTSWHLWAAWSVDASSSVPATQPPSHPASKPARRCRLVDASQPPPASFLSGAACKPKAPSFSFGLSVYFREYRLITPHRRPPRGGVCAITGGLGKFWGMWS